MHWKKGQVLLIVILIIIIISIIVMWDVLREKARGSMSAVARGYKIFILEFSKL